MIPAVPQSTIEKPLTVVDYVAALSYCENAAEVSTFSEQLPLDIRQDDRFNKAVARHLAQLQKK